MAMVYCRNSGYFFIYLLAKKLAANSSTTHSLYAITPSGRHETSYTGMVCHSCFINLVNPLPKISLVDGLVHSRFTCQTSGWLVFRISRIPLGLETKSQCLLVVPRMGGFDLGKFFSLAARLGI